MAPIHDAAAKGDLAQVSALLDAGTDINGKTWFWGLSPLQLALKGRHTAVVKLLLERGADAKALKSDADSLLAAVISEGRADLVPVLLDHGCGTANDALHFAVHCGMPELTTAMLARGAKVEGKNAAGLTFLMQAAVDKNFEIARILLDHGAKASAKKSDGATALHFACTQMKKPPTRELIELLLQRGADVNARIRGTDLTPLWAAWSVDDRMLRLELIRFLLENGADLNIRLFNAQRVLAEKMSLGEPSAEAMQGESLLEATLKTEADDTALISLLQNWNPKSSARAPQPAQPTPEQSLATTSISVQCDSCAKQFKAPIQAAGKTTKCPKCSQPIVIPHS